MTTPIPHDGLLGTFAVIEPERWEAIDARLRALPFGRLWIDYEGLLDDIKMAEWQLGEPDKHMVPEEIPQRITSWDELRQMQAHCEEILVERGWGRTGPPAAEELPHCHVCRYRMNHWDKEENVCDDCRHEIQRDLYEERLRDEGRYR
jgi:hypothetical protein